jgi:2-oxoglutarate dehydrogenase complex dehydrogenase (E1) component-like enzyme
MEGQGPEHSSARLERFLQLAAQDNMRVANCTTAAQYFHLLRRQAARLETDPRPLVLMTPKSLLRHPLASSAPSDLTSGTFRPVIDDASAADRREKVTRLVLCSGRIAVDLELADERKAAETIAIARVEQLAPFQTTAITRVVEQYPNLEEILWVQEEPRNMGAWTFMAPRLQQAFPDLPVRYVGRPDRSSPAVGAGEGHRRCRRARGAGQAWRQRAQQWRRKWQREEEHRPHQAPGPARGHQGLEASDRQLRGYVRARDSGEHYEPWQSRSRSRRWVNRWSTRSSAHG